MAQSVEGGVQSSPAASPSPGARRHKAQQRSRRRRLRKAHQLHDTLAHEDGLDSPALGEGSEGDEDDFFLAPALRSEDALVPALPGERRRSVKAASSPSTVSADSASAGDPATPSAAATCAAAAARERGEACMVCLSDLATRCKCS